MARQVSNSPHMITTAPKLTVCWKCKRPVLAATLGGIDRRVDTATLNDAGELAALLEGRATFGLVGGEYLARRTVAHIKSDRQLPVLAEHACKEIPDHHIEHAWMLAAQALILSTIGATVSPVTGDQPPF